ncbi:hypothetical protein Back2_17770 [Nocardioides baekrokdamisoli]|uniref:Uncharacterized protein n=1 Tax=Nocardioides baekrokdamisoli TaxID=1804624 RepID=A0A3G9IES6_9ACTN|nr:hypothetical protein [Nocardioides baekrokdamisoli]BBH17490.1 hypothetical protein Back2_17770 [Nocardioides baekrokdamisoli]
MANCLRCQTVIQGRAKICPPCKAGTEPPLAQAEPAPTPEGLHRRGAALWKSLDLEAGTHLGEIGLEACRAADRLQELDRIIAGKGVLNLLTFRLHPDWWDHNGDQHVSVTVGFQSVLQEARMQQIAFKELLKDIRVAKAAAAANTPAAPAPAAQAAPSTGLDQLAERRAAREQTTS